MRSKIFSVIFFFPFLRVVGVVDFCFAYNIEHCLQTLSIKLAHNQVYTKLEKMKRDIKRGGGRDSSPLI